MWADARNKTSRLHATREALVEYRTTSGSLEYLIKFFAKIEKKKSLSTTQVHQSFRKRAQQAAILCVRTRVVVTPRKQYRRRRRRRCSFAVG